MAASLPSSPPTPPRSSTEQIPVTLRQALQALLYRHLKGTWVHALALHLVIILLRLGPLLLACTSFLDLTMCVLTVRVQKTWRIKEVVGGIWEGFELSGWEWWGEWKFARRVRLQRPSSLRLNVALHCLHLSHQTLSHLPSHLSPRRGPFYHPGFCMTPQQRALRNSIDAYIDSRLASHRPVDAEEVHSALWQVARCSAELAFSAEGVTEAVWKEEVEKEYKALLYLNYRIFLAQQARLGLSSSEPSRGRQFAPPYYSGELLVLGKREGREFGKAVGGVCWELVGWWTAFGGKARAEWVRRRLARARRPDCHQPRRQPTSLELSLLRLNALITHTHLLHPTPRPSSRGPPTSISIPLTDISWIITQNLPPDEPRVREQILEKLSEELGERDWLYVWEEWRRCVVELGLARREVKEVGSRGREEGFVV